MCKCLKYLMDKTSRIRTRSFDATQEHSFLNILNIGDGCNELKALSNRVVLQQKRQMTRPLHGHCFCSHPSQSLYKKVRENGQLIHCRRVRQDVYARAAREDATQTLKHEVMVPFTSDRQKNRRIAKAVIKSSTSPDFMMETALSTNNSRSIHFDKQHA